ncbi:DUF5988 family protein [Streptomyces sp. NRRL S-350]|uniref:DUF5988 family protein n=1 Tax=Streptomyces sp. NRRL S-350 TaxID=1463902 RepID=UPI0004C14506|nr:DUF5988 family protein [Streptomyces sp. NRRL S-350]
MGKIKALLVGGPHAVRDEDRIQHTDSLTDSIKYSCYGGYEHFRHAGEFVSVDGDRTAVFEWTARTAIAE